MVPDNRVRQSEAASGIHRLSDICHGRSGDKGNHANIAIIAYTANGYAWIREHLTQRIVSEYFAPMQPSRVVRYESANIWGLNFMMYDILAGGASQSLHIDTQGKSLGLILLQMPIQIEADLHSMLRQASHKACDKK